MNLTFNKRQLTWKPKIYGVNHNSGIVSTSMKTWLGLGYFTLLLINDLTSEISRSHPRHTNCLMHILSNIPLLWGFIFLNIIHPPPGTSQWWHPFAKALSLWRDYFIASMSCSNMKNGSYFFKYKESSGY